MFLRKTDWRKWQRRAGLVGVNSLHSLLTMALTPLVSLLVIRQTSAAVWGMFVTVLIAAQLGAHLVAWGNDAYLLRAFSRNPAELADAWQSSLRTRSALFVGLALLAGLFYRETAVWLNLLRAFSRNPAGLADAWQSSLRARSVLFVGLALLAGLFYRETAVWLILLGAGLALQQSCAVLVTYRRDFFFAAGVELAGLAGLVTAVLYTGEALTPDYLLRLFALIALAKAAVLLLRYWEMVKGGNGRFQPRYFLLALPFFLLGFGGALNSRLDLYIIAFYFPAEELGVYQVFSSLLLYIQTLTGFILLPFVKTIYRLPYAAIRRIARSLFGLGILIVPIAMLALSFLLSRLYGILLPSAFYWLGGLAVLPLFYFSPLIYALYKAEKQTTILWVNLLGIGSALILNLILLPRLGLIGAVVSMSLMKWLVLLVYDWQSRRL